MTGGSSDGSVKVSQASPCRDGAGFFLLDKVAAFSVLIVKFRKGDGKDAASAVPPVPTKDRQSVQRTDEGFPLRSLLRTRPRP